MRGFTLLEVVIALAVLAISLSVLLQSQASSLNNAGRSRDLTVAALLARGKMIDLEKQLFHDGFTLNTEEDDGDFRDEGHPEITWKVRISEAELDMSALSSLCGAFAKKGASGGKETTATDCENAMGGLSGALGSFTEELGRSMRLIDLLVTWPDGRFHQSMSVHALITRDDFATAQESDLMRGLNQQNAAARDAGLPLPFGGGTTGGTTGGGYGK